VSVETLFSLLEAHPYLLLFPLVAVEGPLATLCAGLLVAAGLVSWPLAYPLVVAADLLGDAFYYLVGRSARRSRLRGHLPRFGLTDERLAELGRAFRKNEGKVLVGAKVADLAAIPTFVAAGLVRVGFGRFLAWTLAATLPKAALLMVLGFLFGLPAARYLDPLTMFALVLIVLSGYLAAAGFYRRLRRRKDEGLDR
jgi:membrane-associated protein